MPDTPAMLVGLDLREVAMPDTMETAPPAMPVVPDTSAMGDEDTPAMTGTPDLADTITVMEAARALVVSERTVRRWVAAGELSGIRVRGPHGPELRIDRGAVAAYRMIQPPPADRPVVPVVPDSGKRAMTGTPDLTLDTPAMTGIPSNSPPAMPDTSVVVQVLQARLEGAQLAAKLNAKRREDARRQADEERQRLIAAEERARVQETAAAAEIEFLRQQLQQRTDAERELRILLAQANQAVQMLTEKPALEAHTPPAPRRRWWILWHRVR
jgi:excisionase family DNA binding protein